ncbi:hypothetical protein [Pseudolysinimonas sp.]|jgi:hypothetical protein|uniref:hypothetical protein n=1 Tax=Pseudolysinimonas sp. TaxID=2680009 RepID=UPI003783FE73
MMKAAGWLWAAASAAVGTYFVVVSIAVSLKAPDPWWAYWWQAAILIGAGVAIAAGLVLAIVAGVNAVSPTPKKAHPVHLEALENDVRFELGNYIDAVTSRTASQRESRQPPLARQYTLPHGHPKKLQVGADYGDMAKRIGQWLCERETDGSWSIFRADRPSPNPLAKLVEGVGGWGLSGPHLGAVYPMFQDLAGAIEFLDRTPVEEIDPR